MQRYAQLLMALEGVGKMAASVYDLSVRRKVRLWKAVLQ